MEEVNNILLIGSIDYITMRYEEDGSPLLSLILKVSNFEDSDLEQSIYDKRCLDNESYYDLSIRDEKALMYSNILKENNLIKVEGKLLDSNSYYEDRKEFFDKTILVNKLDIIFGGDNNVY